MALIAVGFVLYARERRRRPVDLKEPEFESPDGVLDAILALDDLHQAGKISDEAYRARRAELKEMLKAMA